MAIRTQDGFFSQQVKRVTGRVQDGAKDNIQRRRDRRQRILDIQFCSFSKRNVDPEDHDLDVRQNGYGNRGRRGDRDRITITRKGDHDPLKARITIERSDRDPSSGRNSPDGPSLLESADSGR